MMGNTLDKALGNRRMASVSVKCFFFLVKVAKQAKLKRAAPSETKEICFGLD